MGKVLCLVGSLLILFGWIRLHFLLKSERIEKNVTGVLENYNEEDILSEKDWKQCTEYIQKPLTRIGRSLKIVFAGAAIIVIGAMVQLVGIWS